MPHAFTDQKCSDFFFFACVRDKRCVIRRNALYWFGRTILVGDVAHVREMRHALYKISKKLLLTRVSFLDIIIIIIIIIATDATYYCTLYIVDLNVITQHT